MSVEYDYTMDLDEFQDYFYELTEEQQKHIVKSYLNSDVLLRAMMINYIQDETHSVQDRKKIEELLENKG